MKENQKQKRTKKEEAGPGRQAKEAGQKNNKAGPGQDGKLAVWLRGPVKSD